MAKVLTESEVAAIGGTSTSYGNRCCTKARAEELGCTVTEPSGAISNQLITGVEPGAVWVPLNLLVGDAIIVTDKVRRPEYNNIQIYAVGIVPFSSQSSSCRLGFCNEPNMTINTSAIDVGSRLWCAGDSSDVGFQKTENGSIVYWSGWNSPKYLGFETQDIKTYDGHTVSNIYVYENNNPSKISEYDKFSASPMYFYVYQQNANLYNYYVQISKYDLDYSLYGGHDYVDLGLPSGTKWATMNVGASSETDYGNYYMYGKGSKVYDSTDTVYKGTEDPLAASADTAAQVWDGSWHMPTKAQMEELIANTTYKWVTNYKGSGINGGTFTATNGAVLFIPAAGYWFSGSYKSVGSNGYCWSSSPLNDLNAFRLGFWNGGKSVSNYGAARSYGVSVRPVVG